jgi:hypothetical protein
MLGASLKNLVALVTWRAGFVYRCYTHRLLPNNVPYDFLFMAITVSAMSVCILQKYYHSKILPKFGRCIANFGRCIATQNFTV